MANLVGPAALLHRSTYSSSPTRDVGSCQLTTHVYRQEVIVGTKNGGVLVLSIEVNSDHEDQEIESNQSRSGARGGGTASGTPRPGEDARSRPSTPAIEEDPPFAREEAEEWLVGWG